MKFPLVSVNPSAVMAVVEGPVERNSFAIQSRSIDVVLIGGERVTVAEVEYPMVPLSSYRSAYGNPIPFTRPPAGSPEWDMYDDAVAILDSLFDVLFASIQRRFGLQPV